MTIPTRASRSFTLGPATGDLVSTRSHPVLTEGRPDAVGVWLSPA
ncbi:hypothetical protein ACFVYF_37515 [Streptomyces sp. NPDC058274]